MNTQNSTAPGTDTSVEHDAAAGLSDEEYAEAENIPAAAAAAFDPKAASGLSDEEYLQDGTAGPAL